MSNAIDILNFHNQPVRLRVNDDGAAWWVAKDVCDCLGIAKYRDAVARLDDDERVSIIVDTPGGQQEMSAVNEFGLYTLVFSSRKEEAKVFKRWLAHEVIPSIRRTGRYVAPGRVDEIENLRAQVEELRSLLLQRPAMPLTTDAAPLVQAFWDAVDQLPRETIDHSRNPNELAVSLPHFHEVAKEHQVAALPAQKLKYVLKHCSSYLRQTKVYSHIWSKPVHCWVFHLPEGYSSYD